MNHQKRGNSEENQWEKCRKLLQMLLCVVVPIKDNTYFSKFSLWLARSPCVSNICIYLHSGDPHDVWYSLNNGGHNISFGKCTRGLTILDPKFR